MRKIIILSLLISGFSMYGLYSEDNAFISLGSVSFGDSSMSLASDGVVRSGSYLFNVSGPKRLKINATIDYPNMQGSNADEYRSQYIHRLRDKDVSSGPFNHDPYYSSDLAEFPIHIPSCKFRQPPYTNTDGPEHFYDNYLNGVSPGDEIELRKTIIVYTSGDKDIRGVDRDSHYPNDSGARFGCKFETYKLYEESGIRNHCAGINLLSLTSTLDDTLSIDENIDYSGNSRIYADLIITVPETHELIAYKSISPEIFFDTGTPFISQFKINNFWSQRKIPCYYRLLRNYNSGDFCRMSPSMLGWLNDITSLHQYQIYYNNIEEEPYHIWVDISDSKGSGGSNYQRSGIKNVELFLDDVFYDYVSRSSGDTYRITIPGSFKPSSIKIIATDNVGLSSELETNNLIPDISGPEITPNAPVPIIDRENFNYQYTQDFSISDSGVGLNSDFSEGYIKFYFSPNDGEKDYCNDSNSAEEGKPVFDLISTSVEPPDGFPSNYKYFIDNMKYRISYTGMTLEYIYRIGYETKDLLENVNNGEIQFGFTKPPTFDSYGDDPIISVNNDGSFITLYKLILGENINDPIIGYSSLNSKFFDHLVDVKDTNELELIDGDSDPGNVDLSFDVNISDEIGRENLISHSKQTISTNAVYRNGTSEPGISRYPVLPNIPLLANNNLFSFKFYRDDELIKVITKDKVNKELKDYISADESISYRFSDITKLFYSDIFELQVDVNENINGKDIEGDELYLRIVTSEGPIEDIPCFNGRITFNSKDNTITAGSKIIEANIDKITSIQIVEKYEEENMDGGLDPKCDIYDLNCLIEKDEDINEEYISSLLSPEDLDNHIYGTTVASNDGELNWKIRFGSISDDGTVNKDFHDQSGIQEITFFEYGEDGFCLEAVTYEDYKKSTYKDSYYFDLEGDNKLDASKTNIYEFTFNLEDIEDGTAEERNIGIYIQDFAGNYKLESRKSTTTKLLQLT